MLELAALNLARRNIWLLALLAPPTVFLQFNRLDIRFSITMLFGIGHLTERTRPGDNILGVARTDPWLPLGDTPRLWQQRQAGLVFLLRAG
jgi:hypothetical protein